MCATATWRCACGHVAEWHYKVDAKTGTPIYRDPCLGNGFLPGIVRCPSHSCACTEITDPKEIQHTPAA